MPRRPLPLIPLLAAAALASAACADAPMPRPRGYLRFDFPQHAYEPCPVGHAAVIDKPVYMERRDRPAPDGEVWFDLAYPHYKTTIHLSYKPVRGDLDKLADDVHYFVYKHAVKATGIDERRVCDTANRVYGVVYSIKGDVASNVQFVVTDSARHFLRGSLYVGSRPNEDSLAPIIDFTRVDIERLATSVRWR